MKNKVVFSIGMICLVVFIGIASYLWYIYFGEYEKKLIAENKGLEFIRNVEFINSGSIDYVNATTEDEQDIIPVYHFRVKNNSNKDFEYELYLEDSNGNGNNQESLKFNRGELKYELKLDNRVIKSGLLSTLNNNLLDSNIVNGMKINDYSLRIWLNEENEDYENKHFHYVVIIKEKE